MIECVIDRGAVWKVERSEDRHDWEVTGCIQATRKGSETSWCLGSFVECSVRCYLHILVTVTCRLNRHSLSMSYGRRSICPRHRIRLSCLDHRSHLHLDLRDLRSRSSVRAQVYHRETKFNLPSHIGMMNRSTSVPTRLKCSKSKRTMLGRDLRWGYCPMQLDLRDNIIHQGPKASGC